MRMTRARYVVLVGGYLALSVTSVEVAVAQSSGADEWRAHFSAGEEARQSGDAAGYSSEMAAAARLMPAGHLNRPFVQYHAARAAALQDRPAEAAGWLRTAWDEGIESLMISFARFDPAFVSMDGTPLFEGVMGLAADMTLDVRPLSGQTHLLSGAGSNLLAQVGADGVFLVDTGYGPALPALRRALASVGGDGVDLLLVTHPHEDHMGAAAELGELATVLGHPGTTAAMREPYTFMDGVDLPAKAASALPDVEVTADTTFVFNGERVRLVPTVAHTAGDVSVYFEESKVVHFGDTYLAGNPMMFPGTADAAAFLDRLETFLDSMAPETIVVAGHEEPTDLSAVRAQIEASRACMAYVEGALAEGLTIEETAEQGSDRFPVPWIAFFYGYFSAK
jgi:glyoxylase-like metal-dependent hydrolase (beta-lactamase superfamily II)